MPRTYSAQEVNGHRNITVPADYVNLKGWEKGQGLSWKIEGSNKNAILQEGDDLKLQYNQNRYFVTVTMLDFLINSVAGTDDVEFIWEVNSNGNLELKKYKQEV